jgi:hypothetical protein
VRAPPVSGSAGWQVKRDGRVVPVEHARAGPEQSVLGIGGPLRQSEEDLPAENSPDHAGLAEGGPCRKRHALPGQPAIRDLWPADAISGHCRPCEVESDVVSHRSRFTAGRISPDLRQERQTAGLSSGPTMSPAPSHRRDTRSLPQYGDSARTARHPLHLSHTIRGAGVIPRGLANWAPLVRDHSRRVRGLSA